jgi:hypothetical protein
MAWIDQCKIEACNQIEYRMKNGMSKREALRVVSSESNIPMGTLNRWKYSKAQCNGKELVKSSKNEIKLIKSITKRLKRITSDISTGFVNLEETEHTYSFSELTLALSNLNKAINNIHSTTSKDNLQNEIRRCEESP